MIQMYTQSKLSSFSNVTGYKRPASCAMQNTPHKKLCHDVNNWANQTSRKAIKKKNTSLDLFRVPKKSTYGLAANTGATSLNILSSGSLKRKLPENTPHKKLCHDVNNWANQTSRKAIKKKNTSLDLFRVPKKSTYGLAANTGATSLNILSSGSLKRKLPENTPHKKLCHDVNNWANQTSRKAIKKKNTSLDLFRVPKKSKHGLAANTGATSLNIFPFGSLKRKLPENTPHKKLCHDVNNWANQTSRKAIKKKNTSLDLFRVPKKSKHGLAANTGATSLNIFPFGSLKRKLPENESLNKSHFEKQSTPSDVISFCEKITYGLAVNIDPSWYPVLKPQFLEEYFIKLSKFVKSARERGTVYPPPEEVFGFTRSIKIDKIKVVIIGQSPYPGPFLANGLSFCVKKGIPVPPTLQNIYNELGLENQKHGDLQGWADQGVLLLNVSLTVEAYRPNSHKNQGWKTFTDAIVSWLSKNRRGIIFMLWGCYAKMKQILIDKRKHHILMTSLPSPQSAKRGFLGCNHFQTCNQLLKEAGQDPIEWNNLP